MADIFPDEGLDLLLAVVPDGGTTPATMWLGLFTGGAGSAVPASGATLAGLKGAGTSGFAEVSQTQWATYTRMTHPAGSWGAVTASTVWGTTGRIVTGSQIPFAAPQAGAYTPTSGIGGFFLCNNLALTAGSAYYYSNFSDSSTIPNLQIGDVVKVTPSFGYGN